MNFPISVVSSPSGHLGDLANQLVSNLANLQQDILDSPLFVEMNNIGAYIAVLFIALYSLKLMSAFEDGNKEKVIRMILAAMVAVYFHVNGGANLKLFILGNIGIQNKITDDFASKVLKGRTLGTAYENAGLQANNETEAQNIFSACKTQQVNNPTFDLKNCLSIQRGNLNAQTRTAFDKIAKANGIDFGWDLGSDIGNSLGDAIKSIAIELLAAVELAIRVFSQVNQMIFSLLAPLAVGAIFVPGEQSAIISWTFNFWKIWLFRLSMVVLSGLVAFVFEGTNNGVVGFVLGICLAFLSPWLSYIVATGSGTAILQGLTSASQGGAANTAGLGAFTAKGALNRLRGSGSRKKG